MFRPVQGRVLLPRRVDLAPRRAGHIHATDLGQVYLRRSQGRRWGVALSGGPVGWRRHDDGQVRGPLRRGVLLPRGLDQPDADLVRRRDALLPPWLGRAAERDQGLLRHRRHGHHAHRPGRVPGADAARRRAVGRNLPVHDDRRGWPCGARPLVRAEFRGERAPRCACHTANDTTRLPQRATHDPSPRMHHTPRYDDMYDPFEYTRSVNENGVETQYGGGQSVPADPSQTEGSASMN